TPTSCGPVENVYNKQARGRVRIRDGLLIEQVICISKIKLLNITPFAIGVMFNPVKCYLI
ncbi:hypothetical protein, partial [Escherichia coli]|uniref:hypothetical protein n=1 Tax=Escherichia coli TaxID=562 RepID=UPI001BC83554